MSMIAALPSEQSRIDLKAEVLEYPGGKPQRAGDIGFILS